MGDELGDERDPLLVRPFLLPDRARHEPASSTSTWPAQPNSGDQSTQLLPAVSAGQTEMHEPAGSQRWRPLILIGAAVAAVVSIAGYALLRPAATTGEWVSQPGLSLPAAVGPSIAGSDVEESDPTDGQPGNPVGGTDADPGTSTVTRTKSPKPAASSAPVSQPPVPVSAAPSGSPVASATSRPPISLLPSAIPTGQGMLANGAGLCLDLRGGRAAEGRDVHVDTCNGTSPQRWRLTTDRTLEVLNMCAYLVGDGTVELTRCDGRTTAQWQLFDNGVLMNMSNGLCLTDPRFGTRTSTAVTVTACTGGKNQSWTFT